MTREENLIKVIKDSENRIILLKDECIILQDYIRDKYKININIKHKPFNQKYGYTITGSYQSGESGVLKSYDFKTFDDYYLALEDGLIEVIKNELKYD